MSRFTHPSSLPKAERERQRKVALVSQARVGRFGALPADAAAWWAQMQSVAAELGISISPDDWPVQQPAQRAHADDVG